MFVYVYVYLFQGKLFDLDMIFCRIALTFHAKYFSRAIGRSIPKVTSRKKVNMLKKLKFYSLDVSSCCIYFPDILTDVQLIFERI